MEGELCDRRAFVEQHTGKSSNLLVDAEGEQLILHNNLSNGTGGKAKVVYSYKQQNEYIPKNA